MPAPDYNLASFLNLDLSSNAQPYETKGPCKVTLDQDHQKEEPIHSGVPVPWFMYVRHWPYLFRQGCSQSQDQDMP